jgi:hypothetical protein
VTVRYYPHSSSCYAKFPFISGSPVEILYAFLISPVHTACSASITVRVLRVSLSVFCEYHCPCYASITVRVLRVSLSVLCEYHCPCYASITVRVLMPVACPVGTVILQQVGRLINRGSIRGSRIFSSSTSRPAVWPKQPPIQWVMTASVVPSVQWPGSKTPLPSAEKN